MKYINLFFPGEEKEPKTEVFQMFQRGWYVDREGDIYIPKNLKFESTENISSINISINYSSLPLKKLKL